MLLEGWWRWKKCCCCCTVQTGTTILGILRLISAIVIFIVVCAISIHDAAGDDSDRERQFRQLLTTGTKALLGIFAVIDIIVTSLLLHGNFKNVSRIMKPAVYWSLICIIFNTIFTIVGICQAASIPTAAIAPQIVSLMLGWVIGLAVIQVFRCRIADIEEVEIH